MPDLETVLRRRSGELASLPGVAGVAQGQEGGRPCIRVFVGTDDPDRVERIPSELEGYPVVVEPHGELRALGGIKAEPPRKRQSGDPATS